MTQPPPAFPPDADLLALLNAHRGGFDLTIGLTFTRVSADEVVAEIPVTPHLTQPYGLVHGGVYCSIVESLASAGAAINAAARGQTTVGLENTTSFVRAIRAGAGTITGTATPIHRGRATQVWEVTLRDHDHKVAATGRVRMLCLEAGAKIGGETVKMKT